ncbi:hypothetical protein GCM10009109_13060 [Marinobacterium sediminicola]
MRSYPCSLKHWSSVGKGGANVEGHVAGRYVGSREIGGAHLESGFEDQISKTGFGTFYGPPPTNDPGDHQ